MENIKNIQMCKECGDKPVLIKKRGLCSNCYQKQRRIDGPYISGPLLNDREVVRRNNTPLYKWINFQKRLRDRYGYEFISDLLKLKSTPMTTLDQFGKKYKVTREYIRQIFHNYFGFPYTEAMKQKAEIVKNDVETCRYDPRHIIAESPDGSSIKTNAKCVLDFSYKVSGYGFDAQNSCKRSVSLVVNGFSVNVKTCFSPHKTFPGAAISYYRYACTTNETRDNDFFACYRPDLDKFVIIPNPHKGKSDKRFSIYMNTEKSDHPRATNMFWEYIDRYDLLELKN